MRRRAKASQSDDEEQAERSASPHYASSEDEKAAEEPEEQNGEDGHDNATNDKEQETASNKKKEEKAKPEDPAFVPKSGRFFMHDDRAEDVKDSDARDQKKLWSEEEEEGVWLHDKFNELNVNSDRQKGRRNSYSKNSKYVNKRDNTYKDKHTSQQQYRRKTEAQPQTEPQQQQTQQNHEQPKSSPRSTESKPIHTQSTSNGTKSYAQREQNYQPKSRGTTYRAKQSYNRNSDYSSAPSSNSKEGSKRYSSQRESSTTSQTTSTDHQQQVYQSTGSQDYPPSVQQYPKQQMRPSKSYVPRSNANTKQAPSTVPSSVPAPLPEEYNVISSASSMQYNYGYNVPAMASQYHQGVYNPYYPYQYPYPYIPSMPSVVPPTDPAIISQGSIQYYSVPYVEDPTTSKKAAPVNDTNASQTNKSQWVPKRSHAIPIKEPPQETKNSPSKSTQ